MDRRTFLLLLAAGCSPNYTMVRTNDLNILAGRIHPYTKLSLAKGDKRLSSFAQSKERVKEEGFLRFRYEGSPEALWIDIAYEQTDREAIFNQDLIRLAIKKLGSRNDGLLCQMQHIHPYRTLEEIYREHFQDMMPFGIPQITVELASIPSSRDIATDVWLREEAQGQAIEIERSRVYVPTGKFDYRAEEGIKRLYNDGGEDGIEEALTKAQMQGVKEDDLEATLWNLRKAGLSIKFYRQRMIDPIQVE